MSQPENKPASELVTVIIDGKSTRVPKGMNIIEVAKQLGVEIPHYCYHPHLSVAGNCRMCQVKVKGMPKLEIACNMTAREGLEIQTQHTSPEVKDTQASVLEFILINHPLDCTVCDQAGHCKLQDYHYEYNARPSRFVEDKVHKVKAEPLGPNVILDGERCIMCTRCIRFCDEITETSELGMINRGDHSMITINPAQELNNALSGTVVDLCPVGALTHRQWRFNTRIWFTKQTDSICTGCSTGCNVRVAERDGEIVQVKAKLNSDVNKEWLCDEGRYGFGRFIPVARTLEPLVQSRGVTWDLAIKEFAGLGTLASQTLVLLSPDLLVEDYWAVKKLIEKHLKEASVVVNYVSRSLSKEEKVLVSPDYSCNFRAVQYLGLINKGFGTPEELEEDYKEAIAKLTKGNFKQLLLIGERGLRPDDYRAELFSGLTRSFAIVADNSQALLRHFKVVLPTLGILEKSGLLINRNWRLQYAAAVLNPEAALEPVWKLISRISKGLGADLVRVDNERQLTQLVLKEISSGTALAEGGLTIAAVKNGGINLTPKTSPSSKESCATSTNA